MKRNLPAIALLFIGLLQMCGDVLHIPALKGIGAASGASPAPKVFSAVRGLETYSTRFYIEWTDSSAAQRSLEITPEVYAGIQGPYNRRNVYGAAMAYGPVLSTDKNTAAMFNQLITYSFCGDGPLLLELGIDPSAMSGVMRIRLAPKKTEVVAGLPLSFEVRCDE